MVTHDDIIKWKHFLHYWPFVRGIHRWPVNSPHKGQWLGAFMFSLIFDWINGWVNNYEACDLRHHHAHYDIIVTRAFIFVARISQVWTLPSSLEHNTFQYKDVMLPIWEFPPYKDKQVSPNFTFIIRFPFPGRLIYISNQPLVCVAGCLTLAWSHMLWHMTTDRWWWNHLETYQLGWNHI